MADFHPMLSYDTSILISSGGTTTTAVDLGGWSLVGFIMPAAFTGTSVTFQMSPNNGTYYSITNTDGNALAAVVAASKAVLLAPGDFIGARFLKLVSGATEGADRTITLILRKVA